MLKDENLREGNKTTTAIILYGHKDIYRDLWRTILSRNRSWIKGNGLWKISARYVVIDTRGSRFPSVEIFNATIYSLCARRNNKSKYHIRYNIERQR